MSGWTLSLLGYAGLWVVLNLLAWGIGRGSGMVEVSKRQVTHDSMELFLAMSDDVLLPVDPPLSSSDTFDIVADSRTDKYSLR